MEENDRLMSESTLSVGQKLFVVIDRFVVNAEEENLKRIADSVLTAFAESEGDCVLFLPETKNIFHSTTVLNWTELPFWNPTISCLITIILMVPALSAKVMER